MEIICSTLIVLCGCLLKTICEILTEDVTGTYRQRWQLEVERHLKDQNAGIPMDFGVEQWSEDWKKTVAFPTTPSFYSLEGIHIFALANILRRPILVICANFHHGDCDVQIAGLNLGGIYLPLLAESAYCIKTPLLIGYHQGHFTELVMAENNEGVLLMKYDGESMKVRFLLPEESNYSDRLLREYLNCLKLDYTDENGCKMEILVAKMQACDT